MLRGTIDPAAKCGRILFGSPLSRGRQTGKGAVAKRPRASQSFAQFGANRVLRCAIADFFFACAGMPFAGASGTHPTPVPRCARGHARYRAGARAVCDERLNQDVLLQRIGARGVPRCAPLVTRRPLARGMSRPCDAPRAAEKNRRGLLTQEKTVIRFRRSRRPADASESKIHDNAQDKTDLRPDAYDGGCRFRFPFENASTAFHPNPRRSAWRVFCCRAPGRAASRIRPGAPCASAVGRGSDSRDVASNWAVLAKQVH